MRWGLAPKGDSMLRHVVTVRLFLLALVLATSALSAPNALSANVQFVGSVGYSYVGSTAVLTANRVENFSASGFSGTLHMELWAFPSPYNGTAQVGYKLAVYSLGQLSAGFYYSNITSGSAPFALPLNGTWAVAMFLTQI